MDSYDLPPDLVRLKADIIVVAGGPMHSAAPCVHYSRGRRPCRAGQRCL